MRGYYEKRGTSWSAIVDLPSDPVTGKRRRKRVTAPTKRGVEKLVAATIQSAEAGLIDDGKMTVREYLDRWLEATTPTLKPSPVRRYRDLVFGHISPTLGNVKLSRLGPADIQRMYTNRLATGLSPTTVRHIHGVLHRALSQAVRWGLVARNATDAVDPPRRATPEAKIWDARQVMAFLAEAADDDLEPLWRLALLTGMRRGELLGLMWKDVDLERETLAVRRTLSRGADSRLVASEPKTASGRRQIALPASAVESLRRHRRSQLERTLAAGQLYEDRDLVFATERGDPLHPNSLAARFRKATERAGLPSIRFHDLRHTCATLLLAQGVHPKIVQERLGHADIAMTMNLYSHVTGGMQREAADRLDAAIALVAEHA